LETVKDRIELLDRLDLRGKACAEIGVCHGEYSLEILRRSPKTLYLIDSWTYEGMGLPGEHTVKNGSGHNGYLAVSLRFRGNLVVKIIHKTSFEASLGLGNGELDFAYIDADHALQFVYADLLLWYPKLKVGGWLSGHDLTYPGEVPNGVNEAVRMFCEVTKEKIELITDESSNRSFAIKRTR